MEAILRTQRVTRENVTSTLHLMNFPARKTSCGLASWYFELEEKTTSWAIASKPWSNATESDREAKMETEGGSGGSRPFSKDRALPPISQRPFAAGALAGLGKHRAGLA